jgi:uncharacterized protein (TIGR02448 family)
MVATLARSSERRRPLGYDSIRNHRPIIRETIPMTRLALTCTLLAFSITPALAGSFAASTASTASEGSSASSKSSSPDDKLVLEARDDAASFVASDGRIRGAQLEAALRHLREKISSAQRASDMQLAQAILAL